MAMNCFLALMWMFGASENDNAAVKQGFLTTVSQDEY